MERCPSNKSMKTNCGIKKKENHFQIEKLTQEKEELIKQNNNLKNAYKHCNILKNS